MQRTSAIACAAGFLLAAACSPTIGTAQANPDSIRLRNDCRLAEQVLATGHPAPREKWALGVIWNCRDAGATMATALRAASTSSDTAYLNALTEPFIRLRDGAVFAAAVSVAQNPGATPPARVAAVRTLMYAVQPGGYVALAALSNPHTLFCFETPSPHSEVLNGTPLPADYVQQVRTLFYRIEHDSAESQELRRAAHCGSLLIQMADRTGSAPH
jgi:hypothetical protein